MTMALLPAGGKSSRMGRPKLALPLGGRTVLEQVVAALRQAGIERILVVVGPHVLELIALAKQAGAEVLTLVTETPDMRATVEEGLRWMEAHWRPRPDDDWLLVPADHPTLDPAVVRRLIEARRTQPRHSIVIPTFEDRRGHPALIAWDQVAGMRTLAAGLGLNAWFRRYPEARLEVPVSTPEVLRDLDTPEDYERLLRDWQAIVSSVGGAAAP